MDTNRSYWDKQAASKNVNWHIAHTTDDDGEFYESGKKALRQSLFPQGVDFIKKNGLVLEVGCGKGRMLNALHSERNDLKLVGLDVSPVMITHAYNKFSLVDGMFFVVGNGSDLSVFPDNTFDYIYTFHVLQHLPRIIAQKYIEEMHRVLKSGSRATVHFMYSDDIQKVEPNDDDFRTIRYYKKEEICNLVSDFTVIAERYSCQSQNYYVELEKYK